jgi:hypothetical protein
LTQPAPSPRPLDPALIDVLADALLADLAKLPELCSPSTQTPAPVTSPLAVLETRAQIVTRFERTVEGEPSSGCLLWTGSRNRAGFGVFTLRRTRRLAHQIAWWLAGKRVAADDEIRQSCGVPLCVRLAHLVVEDPPPSTVVSPQGSNRKIPRKRISRQSINST